MKDNLTIAILGRDFSWGGGVDLLRMIANAIISMNSEHPLRVYLLLPVKNKKATNFVESIKRFRKILSVSMKERRLNLLEETRLYDPSFIDYFNNIDGHIETIFYDDEKGVLSVLQEIHADVVLPALVSLGPNFPIPWLGYIYDFQHKYYPQNFTSKECLERDISFSRILLDSRAIVVNSHAVKKDIEKFYPYHGCHVVDLPFSPVPVSTWFDELLPAKLAKYKLPPKYFLISNQFWKHKSHITAYEALAQLTGSGMFPDVHIVCTGKMEDYRFPTYVSGLQDKVCLLKLEDRIHFLGHIPKDDQINIMKCSLALLQPTLFEGGPGGGSVYDAVALGIPVILSDIPINREVENADVRFFAAGSAEDMAQKMFDLLKENLTRPSRDVLIAQGELRRRAMGLRLLRAIEYVVMLKKRDG